MWLLSCFLYIQTLGIQSNPKSSDFYGLQAERNNWQRVVQAESMTQRRCRTCMCTPLVFPVQVPLLPWHSSILLCVLTLLSQERYAMGSPGCMSHGCRKAANRCLFLCMMFCGSKR